MLALTLTLPSASASRACVLPALCRLTTSSVAIARRRAALSLSLSLSRPRPRPMSMLSGSGGVGLPDSPIPIFQTLEQLRTWRYKAFNEGKTVGFVPTMGALHDGHLALVRRSLEDNDLTIVSIFVNPTQFAPHEDLTTYPRTLPQDLAALAALQSPPPSQRSPAAVFVPPVEVMYPPPHEASTFFHSSPSSSSSSLSKPPPTEIGTFVEVHPLSSPLEGRTRPTFFRGVATIVTKLFNATQPTRAYVGQKDIQQALLLRRMVRDLLLAHPTASNLHIVPTQRSTEEEDEGLALSSRNVYLSRTERASAPALYRALRRGQAFWEAGRTKEEVLRGARDVLEMEEIVAAENGVHMKIDYIEMNDPWTLEVVPDAETRFAGESPERCFVLSGAAWVGGTRLIDNVILGDSSKILF